MEWVKQRKNPPCEAIQHNGQPCRDLPQLWDALHGTYNSATGRVVDLTMLEPLPRRPAREWAPFPALELTQALSACSGNSAPGPDHVTWVHLKRIVAAPGCCEVLLALANACLRVGHWPGHFKDSVSVVIPKPGKPSYSTPQAFRPIVLLNTIGKLFEKMIANRFQFDMIALDLVHPNQFGGVRQRSTEDAGAYLTHLVRAGWARKLKTSVIAFDIAQFFPSLNHEFLLAVMEQQGFPVEILCFFRSYLIERFTSYCWNNFKSDPMQADVGWAKGLPSHPSYRLSILLQLCSCMI